MWTDSDSILTMVWTQMLTLSTERFTKIQKEAPFDCQKYLVQVTKYQAAQHCKVILDSQCFKLQQSHLAYNNKSKQISLIILESTEICYFCNFWREKQGNESKIYLLSTQEFTLNLRLYHSFEIFCENFQTWIIGKWTTPREQYWAPSGTHFHQFVVPPIIPFRRDCTYGKLAAMGLPDDVEGLGSCEVCTYIYIYIYTKILNIPMIQKVETDMQH